MVGVHQAAGIAVLPADEDLRRAAAQVEVAVGVADVDQRAHELIAKAVGQRGVGGQAPRVLRVAVGVPLAKIHLRNAGLALARRGQAELEAGQRRAGAAVIERVLGGEAVGELIVAAILEEAPHGPDEPLIGAAEFGAVAADLPVQRIAALDDRVPRVHGSGQVVVAERRVSLHVEIGRAPCGGPAKAGAGDSQFA